jgi:5-methylcytosine-specific restriction endonuclease McrA
VESVITNECSPSMEHAAGIRTKTCYACKVDKDVTQFPRNKRKPDGYDYQCKDCVNARIRASYAKDPAAKIAKTRQYHLDNPEWSRRVLREWHEKNADRRYEEYLERGKDPDTARKRRDATRRCESRRRALKRGAEADLLTIDDYANILDKYDGKCWICEVKLTEELLHWDHYRPLCAGGSHTMDNLRPACGPCNTRKNGMWPVTDERLDAIRRAVQQGR